MIKGIFAMDEHYGIGLNGTLPWEHNSEDLKFFKKMTSNNIVIIGSHTWLDSKFPKPLPNRTNIVVSSSDPNIFKEADRVINFNKNDLKKYITNLDNESEQDVFIIGGAGIFNQLHDIIEEYYITVIKGNYKCDTFFESDLNDFKLIEETHLENSKNTYLRLQRK